MENYTEEEINNLAPDWATHYNIVKGVLFYEDDNYQCFAYGKTGTLSSRRKHPSSICKAIGRELG